jgi:YfiH family protein
MSPSGSDVIRADWPLADRVTVFTTTRLGGVSEPPFDAFNLGMRSGDRLEHVLENRRLLIPTHGLPGAPIWLEQVHGTEVVCADPRIEARADAQWTGKPGTVLALLTADCLPVVLAERSGQAVMVAHAGWRGLAAGILGAAVNALPVPPDRLVAWIGPAIGADAYEVGPEVKTAFVSGDPQTAARFTASDRHGHFLADLPGLAERALRHLGIAEVIQSGICTFSDQQRFYSYRRDGERTGRMATLAWIR